MITNFGFHWYGLIMGIAILVAFEVSKRYALQKKMDVILLESGFWWIVPAGIIGARLYHVIDFWGRYYRFDLLKIFYLWEGGLGIWGGIIGGMIGLMIYLYRFPIRSGMTKWLDICVIGLPLGQAIGRLGNYVNGEIIGRNGEPLFAYEAGLNLLLFLLLWFHIKNKGKDGLIAGIYFIGYGVIRILLENLRPDEVVWIVRGVPVASGVSFLAILLGLYLVKVSRKQS